MAIVLACSGLFGVAAGAGAADAGSLVGSSAARALPRALRGFCWGVVTLENLLRQLNVALRSAGPNVVCQNRLPMTWRLRQSHASRDHCLKHVCPEEFSQVCRNLPREISPVIDHRDL